MIGQNYGTQKTNTVILFQLITPNQYLNTQNKTIYFILQKRQKNRYDKKSLHMLINIMVVLLPFKQNSRMWKNWQSEQENFLPTTIMTALKFCRINWGSEKKLSKYLIFGILISRQVNKPKPQKASRCLPTIFLMMSASMKHLLWANVMPPSRRSSSYLDSQKQQNSLNSLYLLYLLLFTMFKHDNFANILKPVPNSTLTKDSS